MHSHEESGAWESYEGSSFFPEALSAPHYHPAIWPYTRLQEAVEGSALDSCVMVITSARSTASQQREKPQNRCLS